MTKYRLGCLMILSTLMMNGCTKDNGISESDEVYDGWTNSEIIFEETLSTNETYAEREIEVPSDDILNQKTELKVLDVQAMDNRENELVFSFSIDEFIDSYNGYYFADNNVSYLLPSDNWNFFSYDEMPHSKHRTYYYRFQHDTASYNEPSISVYTASDTHLVQEITLDFPEHGYTDWGVKIYKENSFYTLKVFFPDMEDEELEVLYNTLFKMSFEPLCYVYDDETPSPKVLYHKDEVGLYPYMRAGMIYICVIPVTDETISTFEENGVNIIEL